MLFGFQNLKIKMNMAHKPMRKTELLKEQSDISKKIIQKFYA